jgi:prepilin-type N-terminal cleavage/methylation domain-containing protein
MMKLSIRSSSRSGFTLIELITVVSIIALLFSLVVGGFTYADRYSKRQKTEVSIKAIRSALENYSQEFGGYPDAKDPTATIQITNKSYVVGGAACLYQAMSGDGTDAINGVRSLGIPNSDGELDVNESKNVMLKDMPKELWTKSGQIYFMIDGFGHPIRYVKAAPVAAQGGSGGAAQPRTINLSTYDIWALNEDTENASRDSVEVTQSAVLNTASQVWTKNW